MPFNMFAYLHVSFNFHILLFLNVRISFGACGRFTQAELLALIISLLLVVVWMITGHWILMDGRRFYKYFLRIIVLRINQL